MAIIDTIISTVGTVIDRVIPDKNAREKAKEELKTQMGELNVRIRILEEHDMQRRGK